MRSHLNCWLLATDTSHLPPLSRRYGHGHVIVSYDAVEKLRYLCIHILWFRAYASLDWGHCGPPGDIIT
jgi:hypothetical protein